MEYNLSAVLEGSSDAMLSEFLEKYTASIRLEDDERIQTVAEYYSQIFKTLSRPFTLDEITKIFTQMTEYKISFDIPYVVVSNELYGLENIVISQVSQAAKGAKVLKIIDLFKTLGNAIAKLYLDRYAMQLISINNVRRNSLTDLIETHYMRYYEAHLMWLSALAKHILDKEQQKFPQLDYLKCDFGRWLYHDAKHIIQNSSRYKTLKQMHENIHLFARKICNILESGEYHILLTYLEKCEMLSLHIGTELALLGQIDMNKKVAKDTLTEALNRDALAQVFESQYELSLATGKSFVLAMCDLDHFKNINDTYGHLAGDAVLQHFVKIVKRYTRNSDIIIRYGGEEFIIILPTLDTTKGFEILDNIRQKCEQSVVEVDNKRISFTFSVGMSEIKPLREYQKNMLKQHISEVDEKLYIAKDNGRNQVYY